jgi:hypothetical protein
MSSFSQSDTVGQPFPRILSPIEVKRILFFRLAWPVGAVEAPPVAEVEPDLAVVEEGDWEDEWRWELGPELPAEAIASPDLVEPTPASQDWHNGWLRGYEGEIDAVPTAETDSLAWWTGFCQGQNQRSLDELRIDLLDAIAGQDPFLHSDEMVEAGCASGHATY